MHTARDGASVGRQGFDATDLAAVARRGTNAIPRSLDPIAPPRNEKEKERERCAQRGGNARTEA